MELFAKLKTIVTKSYMLDVGRVLNTLLLAVLLIFVDLEVLKNKKYWKTWRRTLTLEEFIFKKLLAFNQQLYLKGNYPIDILRDFAYFLQTLHNRCFQSECMNCFLLILWILTKVATISPDKSFVVFYLSNSNSQN